MLFHPSHLKVDISCQQRQTFVVAPLLLQISQSYLLHTVILQILSYTRDFTHRSNPVQSRSFLQHVVTRTLPLCLQIQPSEYREVPQQQIPLQAISHMQPI